MPDTQISEPLTQVERLRLAIALTESYDDRVFEIEPECVEALLKEYDELRDKYNKITAALSGHVVGWRTMDSAPKDGTVRRFEFSFRTRAFWDDELDRWVLVFPLRVDYLPSHARYLPAPPVTEIEG